MFGRRYQKRHCADTEEKQEDYFASMTDMMVGVLFIFIILLMYFAIQLRQATDVQKDEVEKIRQERDALRQTVERLNGADASRRKLIEDVAERLHKEGIRVSLDMENGILHLPEEILFDSGSHELKPEGRHAIDVLAKALVQVLPCYAMVPAQVTPAACAGSTAGNRVETIFVEGHTDNTGTDTDQGKIYNWNLSTLRAIATFGLLDANPELGQLVNASENPIFSVSGYGWRRPVAGNDSPDNKRKNRRIDLRIVMERPSSRELERIQNQLLEKR
ncbi:MAG: OmpA family protein [Magnetococcales bacterium]|nr:OmpA family protein [Magnetococcales bacterium]MBF0322061.1 OmpA family protein [Magnetococcales bacterium]